MLRDKGYTVGLPADCADEQGRIPSETDPLTASLYGYSDTLKALVKECLFIESVGRPTPAWLVWRTRAGLHDARIAEKNLDPMSALPSIAWVNYPDPTIALRWYSGHAFGPAGNIPSPPPLPPGPYYNQRPPQVDPPVPAATSQPGQSPGSVSQWAQFAANPRGTAPARHQRQLQPQGQYQAPISHSAQVSQCFNLAQGQAPVAAGNQVPQRSQYMQAAVAQIIQAFELGAQSQQPKLQALTRRRSTSNRRTKSS